VLPDIKLLDTQYDEIKALVDRQEPVVLEFDIRNWFKMGPRRQKAEWTHPGGAGRRRCSPAGVSRTRVVHTDGRSSGRNCDGAERHTKQLLQPW
jgi:hypothetical protein